MQDTDIISPDGQSVWNGTEWLPYTPTADASAPLPPATEKPRSKHLGLKITGGVLAVLVAVGVATAGGGEDTGAEAAAPTSTSTPPSVREGSYEDTTPESSDNDTSLPSTESPSLTEGDFQITRSDGTMVTGTLGLSEVMALEDPRVEAWKDDHGIVELPCGADYSRDAVVLGELHLENATPGFSIENFGVTVNGYPLGAVGAHLSSGDMCGVSATEHVLKLKPLINDTSWYVPIQIVVRDYYSPQHPDGQLPTDYQMSFAGYFDNLISPDSSSYRGDLFDLSEDLVWEAPLRIRG